MGETQMQQRRVSDEGLRAVKLITEGRERTVPQQQASANYVPAAAVKRRRLALSGFIGRNARAGGALSWT